MSAPARSGDGRHADFASPVRTGIDELLSLRTSVGDLARQRRRRSAAPSAGRTLSRQLGRGLDFAEVRAYQPGDDVRMIDWNVTARSGHAHTKLFVEERERPLMLVLDLRDSMRFATRGCFKSALAERVAALIGWTALAAGDRVGGLVFTDRWHREIRPVSGQRGLMRVFRAIVDAANDAANDAADTSTRHAPRTPGTTELPALANSLRRLRAVTHPGSTAVVFSDFAGFDADARSALGALVHRLDVLGVQVVDTLDFRLPARGRYTVLAAGRPEQPRLLLQSGAHAARAAHETAFLAHCESVADVLRRGCHLHTLAVTDEPLLDVAARVLSRRALSAAVLTAGGRPTVSGWRRE